MFVTTMKSHDLCYNLREPDLVLKLFVTALERLIINSCCVFHPWEACYCIHVVCFSPREPYPADPARL